MPPVSPVDAASLLLLRDAPAGLQVFMVRRHPRSRFMANAHVFPGGRLDEQDCAPELEPHLAGLAAAEAARRLGLEDPLRARGLYVAALREAFEESGLLLARQGAGGPPPDLSEAQRQDLQTRLGRGALCVLDLLQERGLVLDLGALRHLDRWITPEIEQRRFDARFFVCRAPAGQAARFDPVETTAGSWYTAQALLEGNSGGLLSLAPPTLCILEELGRARTVQQALEAAPDHPVPPTMPRPLLQQGAWPTLLLPGDHRYEDPASRAGAVRCVTLRAGHWELVRSR